jgi:hypothetical protein
MFGGRDSNNQMSEGVWEWDGAQWSFSDAIGPSGREGHGLCYDKAHDVTFLFGGRDSSGAYLHDTWVWNGDVWSQIQVSAPPPRAFFTMAYDVNRQRIVLFGGVNEDSLFGDTWEWDGAEWSLVTIDGPQPRIYSDMCYLPPSGCFIYGGQAGFGGALLNDTWLWNGSNWDLINAGADDPQARRNHQVENWFEELILFGGLGGVSQDSNLSDTWYMWDPTWYDASPSNHPPARAMASSVALDSWETPIFLIGGTDGQQIFHDIWIFTYEFGDYYVPGDANQSGQFDGLDIVYLVNYYKGYGAPPPYVYYGCLLGRDLYAAADLNGNCEVNGIDVVYGVAYLKGLQPSILYCPNCPPFTIGIRHTEIRGDCIGTALEDSSYMYLEAIGNDLHIHHINATYQCCLEYFVSYQIAGNDITATEQDFGPPCDCLCNFNLESILHDLGAGQYTVTLIGIYGDTVGVEGVNIPGL